MAALGVIGEFMNSKEFHLDFNGNQYTGLQDIVVHADRREFRREPIDVGPMYRYGFGDNWVSGTIKLSGPEWGDGATSINKLSQIDSEGDMTITTTYSIKGIQTDGTVKTLAIANGVMRTWEARRTDRKVTLDFFIRILDDTVTIT